MGIDAHSVVDRGSEIFRSPWACHRPGSVAIRGTDDCSLVDAGSGQQDVSGGRVVVSPRKLVSGSLLATGAAGLYFATFPSYKISLAIHAFWGFAIALLFWGAMIRATRMWASAEDQGKAITMKDSQAGVVGDDAHIHGGINKN